MRYFSPMLLLPVFLMMGGCANLPQKITEYVPSAQKTVDPTLVTAGDVRAMPEMSSVGLEWSPTIDMRVVGYRIYRMDESNRTTLAGELNNRYNSHFAESRLAAGTTYTYAVATMDAKGAESNRSTVSVTTLPLPSSVGFIQAVSGLVKQIKVIWRPHDYPSTVGYDVYRNDPKNTAQWDKIATLKGRLNVEWVDTKLDDAKTYAYRVVTLFPDGLETAPSESTKGMTKVPPMVPTNLKATTDQPKKILLSWEPVAGATSYKVYRMGGGFDAFKEGMRSDKPSFIDTILEDGKSYTYQVSALDVEDLEGGKTPLKVQGATLCKPAIPLIGSSSMSEGKLSLQWGVADSRAVSFQIVKRKFTGPFKSKLAWEETVYRGVTDKTFVDPNVSPGERYDYRIQAVDQFGLISEPSESVEIDLTQMVPKG